MNNSKADRFLNTFNKIEKYLKFEYNAGIYASFGKLVRIASHKNGIFNRYKEDLLEYGELRNAIVHNKRTDNRVIAEPHEDIVHQIENIWKQVQNPARVSIFKKKIFYCQSSDKLEIALQYMHANRISHIPIVENGIIVDVLSGNNIAFWLANKNTVSPHQSSILEVLKHAEYTKNFEIVSENISVYDLAEIYKMSFRKPPVNWYYDAILITPKGTSNEKMLGIITLEDIAQYLHD